VIYDERRHKLVSDLYKRQTVFDFERAVSGEDFGGEKKRKKENTRATRKKKSGKINYTVSLLPVVGTLQKKDKHRTISNDDKEED
tara:strand:+ start:1658 stop:1912 length:255 start_codon:yes stop_codon:yes gene_type:complete